jgi:hypothetical protein
MYSVGAASGVLGVVFLMLETALHPRLSGRSRSE